MQPTLTRVPAVSGSLQSHSSNKALVQLAANLADAYVQVDIFEALDQLPYFNPDQDLEPAPAAVADLRARVGTADAVLIASPEYAHEMPGVLKNALDWLVSSCELYGKPVAVLCAAPSPERAHMCAKRWLGRLRLKVERLVAALRRGDEHAFEWLVAQHHTALVRLALRYMRDPAVAEEVAQETWLHLLKGLHQFEFRSSLKTWMSRILMNRARTRVHQERRTLPFAEAWSAALAGGEPLCAL